jgi:hypothetical protein
MFSIVIVMRMYGLVPRELCSVLYYISGWSHRSNIKHNHHRCIIRIGPYQFFKEEVVMGAGALALLLVFGLLIAAGVVISVRLYSQGAVGTGRFRSKRRIRTIRATPDGKVIEETVEEITDEEEPVEEPGL